jgi:hypothetical protein
MSLIQLGALGEFFGAITADAAPDAAVARAA